MGTHRNGLMPLAIAALALAAGRYEVCGQVGACCSPQSGCVDATEAECNLLPPFDAQRLWQPDRLCGVQGQHCPNPACLSATGDCDTASQKLCRGGTNDGQECSLDSHCPGGSDGICVDITPICADGDHDGEECIDDLDCLIGGTCTFQVCDGGDYDGQRCDEPRDCRGSICEGNPGCSDPYCCTDVCNYALGFPLFTEFCCYFDWDAECAALAQDLCHCASGVTCPALSEPDDFPDTFGGPSALQPSGGCFWLASGSIERGDVDWIQVTLPFSSTRTVIDVDFVNGAGASRLFASVAGLLDLNVPGDDNNETDDLCGLGSTSEPLGSPDDSAVDVGATQAGTVIHVGVTGLADTGFGGNHEEQFDYDVWVYATECATDSDCDDGVACTVDSCDAQNGTCSHAPSDVACDNGVFCDGAEICVAALGCLARVPPTCDDDISCTVDLCDTESDGCIHDPDNTVCDDGLFCTGIESCDVELGCQPGVEPDCDDSIGCTVDHCEAAFDACINEADDTACNDGLFCTGIESCDVELGCSDGSPPCVSGQSCDEDADRCVGEGAVGLEIRPGSCPNPLNRRSRGVLPVLLVANKGFDVRQIDLSTLTLARSDGVGGSVSPNEGPRGPRSDYGDLATPLVSDPCACHEMNKDGISDLSMKFMTEAIIDALELSDMAGEAIIELTLSGNLVDGTVFSASDCVRLVPVGPRQLRQGR